MQLPITSLISLDVYRDGGSLSISFRASEGDKEFSLLFPIKEFPEDPNAKWRTYREPILETYIHTVYTSPVTGFSCPSHQKEEVAITWQESLKLLAAAAPLLQGFESDYLWVHGHMVAIAENNGAVTGS